MLSDIAYEQIKDNYWFGIYGEFRVVMMKDSGFINATKMCRDGGKDFFMWKRTAPSQALIHELESMLGTGEASGISSGEVANTLGDGNQLISRLPSNTCKFVQTLVGYH